MQATEPDDARRIERLEHVPGERLTSRDLNDELRFAAALRWWHNRALHGTVGVAYGLEVNAAGDREVRVAKGLAYDAFGRELILHEARIVPLPAGRPQGCGEWMLFIHFPEGSAAAPALRWKHTDHPRPADGVPLARYEGAQGGSALVQKKSFTPPPTRPSSRPLIGRAMTVMGKTDWREWLMSVPHTKGIEVEVDTSATGFTDVPCYFAWLRGEDLGRLSASRPDVHGAGVLARVRAERQTSFVFSLWTPSDDDLLTFARRNFYVCWLGIQMQPVGVQAPGGTHGVA